MAQQFDLESLFSLQGKTALVTGGTSGLGLIMAKGLLQNGVKVFIASRKAANCDAAKEQLEVYGDCVAIAADMTVAEDRLKLVSAIQGAGAGLSILVNNAGANWGSDLADYPDKGFAKVMDINLNAVFSLTRDLCPELEKAGTKDDPARVINIGSMDGIHVPTVSRVGTFAYSASKAALHHLTKVLAVDMAPRNITVNAVAPGFFESKMTDYVLDNFKSDIEDEAPLGRIGRPEEIVGIAIYLASKAGAYTNGTVIPVDGGTSISKGKRDWMD